MTELPPTLKFFDGDVHPLRQDGQALLKYTFHNVILQGVDLLLPHKLHRFPAENWCRMLASETVP
jgi:hypothetical protein